MSENADGEQPVGPHPAIIITKILAAMAEPFIISQAAYDQRVKLMGLHDELAQYGIPFEAVKSAGEVYMYCTYTDAPNKHAIKRTINKWFRDMALASMDVPECTRPAEAKARPKILIPLEWFGTNHSMYRCYAPILASLKERFETVAMYGGDASDPDAFHVFERLLHLPDQELQFDQIVEIIHAESPDIILFPSIGMATWTTTLANIRLAPVQIMFPGHPASSLSPYIDYLLTEKSTVGDTANYSERVIALPDGTGIHTMRSDFTVPKRDPQRYSVAVPSIAQKLIPPFMRALKQIETAVPEVVFHFFPNQTDLQHAMVDYEIRKWFPKARIYPRTSYQVYLDRLAKCSFALDAFPFGGTNSIMDAFIAGIPTITVRGDDIPSRVGAMLIERSGCEDTYLIAESRETYAENAIAFLKHPHWVPDVPDFDILKKKFFGSPGPAVADAIWRLWEETCDSNALQTV